MNEWEVTAEVATWIKEVLIRNPGLPFSKAKCEQRGKGSSKRRDLTLLDSDARPCLTGEIKLPYQKDGGSPYNAAVVKDARAKARRAGVKYFFTWNVNEFVLWETASEQASWRDQNYRSWTVAAVHSERQLEYPTTASEICRWLPSFLTEFSRLLRGTVAIGRKSPDVKFIEALESSLQMPILFNLEALQLQYKKARFKAELDKWMRDEQGWIIHDAPERVRDNIERASKFACYALVNKLVFHEALLKRYGDDLEKLTVPDHIDTGEGLRQHLERHFSEAKRITGDYETVFGEEHTGIGNRIPFYSDGAVSHWRELINQIHEFDFSKLDYEVIGNIFERLNSEEERHKFGQFYTRAEVVDLLNSFCIRSGAERVMDPACGGGTFLVRAYSRKRELQPERRHGQLLNDLFGIDISHFATHLTTINLATRDLIDSENYPQIARSDFFDVEARGTFLTLPGRVKAGGLGGGHREVEIPALDAVIGNPPYVRQEDIPKAKVKRSEGGPEPGTKEYYRDLANREGKAALSARSDIHCYFWPHSASFLTENGYLCFLTSSQWLDVEYGFRLQEWVLRNFEIVAVFESLDEPWFVGARVATTATVLRRQADCERREQNIVRFVQLRRPVGEILAHDGTTAGAIRAADQFRDQILGLQENAANQRYRVRLVPQRDLWSSGVRLGETMRGEERHDASGAAKEGSYYGGKWGVYLRAPDLWFQLLDKCGGRFAPLADLADVRFGVKSGKDCFFFPRDCTAECLNAHPYAVQFEEEFGVPRRLVESGRVKLVRCGEGRGEIRPIEAKYLEPEVHNLMEIDALTVNPARCKRFILLVGALPHELKDPYVRSYIEWGERKGWHKASTCAARVTPTRAWYDLTGHERGKFFWPMAQQYKHAIPANDPGLICNHNLFDVTPTACEDEVLGGILNSTWVVLSKHQYGRPVGVEGNLKTEVIDVKMMLVPDPRMASEKARARVARAFEGMRDRKALAFLSEQRLKSAAYRQKGKEEELRALSDVCELDMADRRELDDAVLELIGVRTKAERDRLRGDLYGYLREFYEWTRQKEERGIANKNAARRRGAVRPEEIAEQVFEDIRQTHPQLLRHFDPDFLDRSKPLDTYDLPAQGTPELHRDMYDGQGVDFKKGKKIVAAIATKSKEQDLLLVLVASSGVRGFVRVPHESEECRRVAKRYADFLREREALVTQLVEQRTADEEMGDKIREAVARLLGSKR